MKTPNVKHGWFACVIRLVNEDDGRGLEIKAELWWNEDSIGSGWWIGMPGNCVGLETLFPGFEVSVVGFEPQVVEGRGA
jgi:hypothetical protein